MVRFPVERRVLAGAPGGWVSARVVAGWFGVSVRTVERWRAEGCPCLRVGRGVRFRLVEVEGWLRGRG